MARGWVTLYTDAGFRGPSEATWGAWVRGDGGRVVAGGQASIELPTSNHAEMYAVLHGVELVMHHFPRTRGIVVRTDSRFTVSRLRYQSNARQDEVSEAIRQMVWAHLSPTNVFLKMTWVRGHASGDTAQACLNRRVDEFTRNCRRGDSFAQFFPLEAHSG